MGNFGVWGARCTVTYLEECGICRAKTAEPIEQLSFGMVSGVSPRNRVLDGVCFIKSWYEPT